MTVVSGLARWIEEQGAKAERASSGNLACHLVRLESGEEASWRGDVVRPAASVVKVPILVELLARAESRDLSLDERVQLRAADKVGGAGVLFELHDGLDLTLRDLGILMIVVSDNTASNMLIDRLGMDRINERIHAIGLPDTVVGRKFMIDPNALHAKNFTSARDMARMMARLHRGELLGPKATQEALDILKRQQYREKIPLLLPVGTEVAHKTGEISHTRHDVAIVYAKHPYALACLTWDLTDELTGDRAIANLSRQIFDRLEGR